MLPIARVVIDAEHQSAEDMKRSILEHASHLYYSPYIHMKCIYRLQLAYAAIYMLLPPIIII